MTIKQYQTVAKTIASKIEELGGNPLKTKYLKLPTSLSINIRDPKKYANTPTTFESGESNAKIEFDTISNPNNPNYKYRTLKPGSMSFYNSQTHVNVDITDFNFDSAQFADLIELIKLPNWIIAH